MKTEELVQSIVKELDGREWGADTCANIATILRDYGHTIRDLYEEDLDAPIFCQDCKREVEAITRTRRDGVQQCSECVLGEEGPQA